MKSDRDNFMNMDISILICTHNSSKRIVDTLNSLKKQKGCENISWEVIIVDYISSDGTLEIAKEVWSAEVAPLICINEQAPGKTPALETGLMRARGNAICIIDDDNWADENYVMIAHDTINAHPDIGVIGAFGIAECEIEPPKWFYNNLGTYAVGSQGTKQGYIEDYRNLSFWGAGSVIRRNAWIKAKQKGFVPILNPTRGESGVFFSKGFIGGEDGELCFAIQLVGYRLWYEPKLMYKHFIPKTRLTPEFINNTIIGVYSAAPLVRLYLATLTPPSYLGYFRRTVYHNWWLHMFYTITRYAQYVCRVRFERHSEKDFEINKVHIRYRAEIQALWHLRATFNVVIASIRKLQSHK
jgi:glycosyltransferase involved in cell wall biosynthesis